MLITLAIIGVVAALTMPSLIANIRDKDLESRYNKAKNIIANGYKLMSVKEDVDNPASLSFVTSCEDENCLSKYHTSSFKILKDNANGLSLDTLPDEYSVQNSEEKSGFKWSDVSYVFTTTDGFVYGVILNEDSGAFSIVADVNNQTRPNTVKKDLYKFRFAANGVLTDVSDELTKGKSNGCDFFHASKCTTQEQCINANYNNREWSDYDPETSEKNFSGSGHLDCVDTVWKNGQCVYQMQCG